MVSDGAIRAAILALTDARAPRSVCPSEVARGLAGDWRPLMADVRRVAGTLAAEDEVVVTQRGQPATVDATGPIRLTRRRRSPHPL